MPIPCPPLFDQIILKIKMSFLLLNSFVGGNKLSNSLFSPMHSNWSAHQLIVQRTCRTTWTPLQFSWTSWCSSENNDENSSLKMWHSPQNSYASASRVLLSAPAKIYVDRESELPCFGLFLARIIALPSLILLEYSILHQMNHMKSSSIHEAQQIQQTN
jgi:hypothetical protein